MAVIKAHPGLDSPLLSIGEPLHLGSLSAANDVLKFTIPIPSGSYGRGLLIQAVPDGTVTTLTTELDLSLDGGTTFDKLNNGPTESALLVDMTIRGCGGLPAQIKASAVTLGTATKVDFYVSAG